MTHHKDVISRFYSRSDGNPLLLPNLTLWYDWHSRHDTLPVAWQGWSLPAIARDLGVPAWQTVRPFDVDPGDVEIVKTETDGRREIHYRSSVGVLTERWILGSDNDWWQTEFAVKLPDDLRVLLHIVSARRYIVDETELQRLAAEIGDHGVVAMELPRRPFSQVFLEWLGWSDGLLLLYDARELVDEIVAVIEQQVQTLVEQIAMLPCRIVVSPDNLDAQFISPGMFDRYLSDSYRRSVDVLHRHDKHLLVGTGGPVARLLKPLAEAGVDGVEGISAPPQSDASLAKARQLTGPDFTLWGGIPQDALLPDFDYAQFETIVAQSVREAASDGRAIIGVADRVPISADLARLRALPALIAQAASTK